MRAAPSPAGAPVVVVVVVGRRVSAGPRHRPGPPRSGVCPAASPAGGSWAVPCLGGDVQRGTRVVPVCLPRRGGRGARFPPSVAVRQRQQPAEAGVLLGAGWSV